MKREEYWEKLGIQKIATEPLCRLKMLSIIVDISG